MAYLGQIRVETAGPVYGWACDFCGQKAETALGPEGQRSPPNEWYGNQYFDGTPLYNIRSKPLTYVSDALYCTERCYCIYNGKPWPAPKRMMRH